MKRVLYIITLLLLAEINILAQTLTINNGASYNYQLDETLTGLTKGVYVVPETVSATIKFTATSTDYIAIYAFPKEGTTYKEEITEVTQVDNVLTLLDAELNCGYIIQQGAYTYTFWLSTYREVTNLTPDYTYGNQCTYVKLLGDGLTIPYYSTSGMQYALPRKFTYLTWVWDEENSEPIEDYDMEEFYEPEEDDTVIFISPYQTTYISVVDFIPVYWGAAEVTTTTEEDFVPTAIFIEAYVKQYERDVENELEDSGDYTYGGSAPVDMTFTAYVNEDHYYVWELFKSDIGADDDDPTIQAMYVTQTLNYVFKTAGTTYVRLKAISGDCEESVTYTVTVNESSLEAPNIFTPGASTGVNDEWRVAYKSIIEFSCVIYDRWGVELFRFTDPAMGWNGEMNGRLVPSGVYFYIIKAKGSDGIEYKLKGDINILRGKS